MRPGLDDARAFDCRWCSQQVIERTQSCRRHKAWPRARRCRSALDANEGVAVEGQTYLDLDLRSGAAYSDLGDDRARLRFDLVQYVGRRDDLGQFDRLMTGLRCQVQCLSALASSG